jgi:2-oxoglutarate dehydrogenase E2 component (dihydrolipoamide succinyltransferase)
MTAEVKVPVVGESVTEGVLVSWFKEEGEVVQADDALFELETDKITMTVAAEAAGRLSIRVAAGSKVAIGQVVGAIELSAVVAPRAAPSPVDAPRAAATPAAPPPPRVPLGEGPPLSPPAGLPQVQAKLARAAENLEELSPAVRRLVAERALDAAQIPGTGKGGRLTKEDVVHFLERTSGSAAAASNGEAPVLSPTRVPPVAPAPPLRDPKVRQTRTPMSSIRHRIAERLVIAQQTAAILTTFNEADLSGVMALRERYRDEFKKRHGVGLGFMSFFVKAAVDALTAVPVVNSQIQGDEIVENHFYDIGVAVGTERGLVVPVIRDADRLGFAEIEAAIADFSRRARDRTLTLNDLAGGSFTISNGGVYGSLLSTPILNPPQSGILGMHAIKRRPMVVGEEIVIRPMMYLALSYDHRLVDGREAVAFLKRVVECIENPERIFLEV